MNKTDNVIILFSVRAHIEENVVNIRLSMFNWQ